MPKGKKRIGLQKDFSTIFEGVWVPPKPHAEEARTEPTAQEQDHAVETPISDEQQHTDDTAAVDDQEHAGDTTISNEQIREIERIMGSMKCLKGFICYTSGFKDLCKVKNLGEGKVIECLPENQGPCTYRFTFTGKIFCKCPLRHYIARNLNR